MESALVKASDWSGVITAMTDQLSVATVVEVLAVVVGGGIGLVFLWWGVRKAAGALLAAFKSGRFKL